jgi:hypothetical protein
VSLVDDGEVVRVSVGCECSCVFWSLDAPPAEGAIEAEALFPGARTAGDLPPGITLRRIDEEVALTSRAVAPRAEIARWSRTVLATPDVDNPVVLLVEQAHALERLATGEIGAVDPMTTTRREKEELVRRLEAFAKLAEEAVASADQWRSSRDRTRVARRLVAEAAREALSPGRLDELLGEVRRARDEMFFVRATLFGHLLGSPWVDALRDAAVRLLVAREIGDLEGGAHHPIATVEMVYRGMIV